MVRGIIKKRGIMLYNANWKSEEMIYRTHPLRVSFGKIIIDRHYMHTMTVQRIKVNCKGCNEGLSFTGFHFSNYTVMKNYTPYKLDIEVPHIKNSSWNLSDSSKRLRQDIIHTLPSPKPLTEFIRFGFKHRVIKRHHQRLKRVNLLHNRPESLNFSFIFRAYYFCQNPKHNLLL